MRLAFPLLLIGFLAANAETTGLELRGQPFKPDTIPVTWSVPKTNLPVALWIYKVVPQQFPAVAISNIMEIAALTAKDKKTTKDSPFKEKNALYYGDKEGTRHLGISPSLGFIEYKDERAISGMREPVNGVPDDDQAMQGALKILHRCAIDSSQLAVKPTGELKFYRTMGRRGRMDKKTGEDKKEVISRGVSFIRQIDRASFTGIGNAGGISVVFGNDGKVAELQIIWRGVEPYKSVAIDAPERFVQWIKEGRSVITEAEPLQINWGKVKKLNVTKFTPYYMGEGGEDVQRFIVPFADLEIEAELPDTNIAFHVSCPIPDDGSD